MIKKIISFILLFIIAGCAQTVPMGFRWDKNTEPDMSHYDLFVVVLTDSLGFWDNAIIWPKDTTETVWYKDSLMSSYRLATMAHIYSPIDSMVFQWNQKMSQGYLRGYITASDSAGNISAVAPSINVVYVGDRDAPATPKYDGVTVFKREL